MVTGVRVKIAPRLIVSQACCAFALLVYLIRRAEIVQVERARFGTRLSPQPPRSCHVFSKEDSRLYSNNEGGHTLKMIGEFGRLGNRVEAVQNLIEIAISACCDVILPENILSGWRGVNTKWYITDCAGSSNHRNYTCGDMLVKKVFHAPVNYTTQGMVCYREIMRQYFSQTATRALGRQCRKSKYGVVHVRSGDIVAGTYNLTSGDFESGGGVHTKYAPYPTSYFAAAISSMLRSGLATVFVFCETMDNPTCHTMRQLSVVEPRIKVRVNETLLDDLQLMLCAEQASFSFGTFRRVIELSETLSVIHEFSRSERIYISRSRTSHVPSVLYLIKDRTERLHFASETATWTNSPVQRFLIDRYYTIVNTTLSSHQARYR